MAGARGSKPEPPYFSTPRAAFVKRGIAILPQATALFSELKDESVGQRADDGTNVNLYTAIFHLLTGILAPWSTSAGCVAARTTAQRIRRRTGTSVQLSGGEWDASRPRRPSRDLRSGTTAGHDIRGAEELRCAWARSCSSA